jgi:hypothetical protein
MYPSGCSMLCQPWRPDGLFEEALAIADVERGPFDLARVQLVHGERCGAPRPLPDRGCLPEPAGRGSAEKCH